MSPPTIVAHRVKTNSNEQRITQKLINHPLHDNIVPILKVGILACGHTFVDMTKCDFTLAQYLSPDIEPELLTNRIPRLVDLADRPRRKHIWKIMIDITQGVDFLHGLGEVHRDLKPSNSNFFVEALNNLQFYSRMVYGS